MPMTSILEENRIEKDNASAYFRNKERNKPGKQEYSQPPEWVQNESKHGLRF
jgi:hypothetical protein